MRPPQISCCVWAKNSISRMPPRPSLMLCPATAMRAPPRWALIWRLIEWMSWIAAKSRCLRHRNGRSSARKARAGGEVAGDRPRLDQRRALPVLPGAFVIGERGDDRQRGRRRAGIGAQPEVGAEDIAVGGALLDQPHQLLRQPPEETADVVLSGVARPFPVIEEDKVDIAGIVQLTRAELAHGEDDEAALPLGRGGVGGGELALALGGGEEMARRGGDRGVGEAAERAGDALELPPAGDVGDRDQQRHLALRDAQRPHQPLLVGLGCEMAIEPALDIRQSSPGPCCTSRIRRSGSLRQHCVRKGLLPKSDASSRFPAASAARSRMKAARDGSSISCAVSRQRSKPSRIWSASPGGGRLA